MTALPTLPPGTVLDGKWSIEGTIGEGGMGAVYRATHLRNGLSVAVKVLHPDLARDRQLRERFLHEGYAANKVGHPGTVRVLDDGQTPEGLVYLVMELLLGETVEAFVMRRGGAVTMAELVPILLATLETLAAAHAMGTVHRDIKPENLFMMREGGLKVLDFGLARVKEATTQTRLTVTGVPMGTPAFMPPEQALAKWDEVDARSDVYSVGASAWNMLTGAFVHEGSTIPQLLVAVSTRPARPIRMVVPQLPAAFANVIDRALAFEPAHRWADAGQMLVALRMALGQSPDGMRSASGHDLSAYAPTMQVPELGAAAQRAMQQIANQSVTEAPTAFRPPRVDVGPPSASLRALGDSDARPAHSSSTLTVAPVSSEAEGTRRKRNATLWIGVGAGAVIALGTAFAAVLFVAGEKHPTSSGTKSALAAGSESAAPVMSSLPSEVLVAPSAPVASATSSAAASSSLPAGPSATASAPITKHTKAPVTTKPTKPVDDPLGQYKRPGH